MAGHGGRDPGASGHGYQEKNVALEDARALRDELSNYDVDVKMLRNSDTFIGINEIRNRTNQIARQYGVDNTVFVSSHWNSHSPKATGWEIWANYPDTGGSRLAASIHKEAKPNLTIVDRGVKYARGSLGVLRANPATVLIEHAFISNLSDIKKHLANRNNMAKAYARGISNYLGVKMKPIIKEESRVSEARIREIIKEELANAEKRSASWAEVAIDYVKEEGIMQGYDDETWKPNKPVTRAELATVIYRMSKK